MARRQFGSVGRWIFDFSFGVFVGAIKENK